MTSTALRAQVGRLRDRLSYVLLHAPTFPQEDQTNVVQEFERLLSETRLLWNSVQDVERRHWLDLLATELLQARECFVQGDTLGGCRLIQSAEDRLADWLSNKKARPTFVVDPSGNARKV